MKDSPQIMHPRYIIRSLNRSSPGIHCSVGIFLLFVYRSFFPLKRLHCLVAKNLLPGGRGVFDLGYFIRVRCFICFVYMSITGLDYGNIVEMFRREPIGVGVAFCSGSSPYSKGRGDGSPPPPRRPPPFTGVPPAQGDL